MGVEESSDAQGESGKTKGFFLVRAAPNRRLTAWAERTSSRGLLAAPDDLPKATKQSLE